MSSPSASNPDPTTAGSGAPSAPQPDIRVEMVSDPVYLSGARELVAAVARRLGFAEEASGQIALALDEALCNIIRHGYERRRDGPIWISVWPLESENGRGPGLRIVVEDEARQVEPEQIRSRELDEIRPGGLGVHIIREVMDQVSYEKRPGAGMRLTLVKWQGAGAPCGCGPAQ
jgi:serine/threonine-protein kinase RsbW